MRRWLMYASLLPVTVLLGYPADSMARPVPEDRGVLPTTVASGSGKLVSASPGTGVLGAASQDTAWFGGTVWAADSSRWEAIPGGVWTFDSGVGSSFDYSIPGVNPYKYGSSLNPAPPGQGLHALMEGWIGEDLTFTDRPYFRRLAASDFSGPACVGSAVGLEGSASLWCGVLAEEAAALCYGDQGPGYGNNWSLCMAKTFDLISGGVVSVGFDFTVETEPGYDFAYVRVDTTGDGSAADLQLAAYTGTVGATHAVLDLVPGTTLRSAPGPFTIKFCVETDGAYSDEDGVMPSGCGAFALDEVSVTGGGVNDLQDFESGNGGWSRVLPLPGASGDWSDLAAVADLPAPDTQGSCSVADSVLVFRDRFDDQYNPFQSERAVSPWIDLAAAAAADRAGRVLELEGYLDLGLLEGTFLTVDVQWYPETCPVTGSPVVSEFTSYGSQLLTESPTCYTPANPLRIDLSQVVPPGAEQVRVALGLVNSCQYIFGCAGEENGSPYIDNVRFGVYDPSTTGIPGDPGGERPLTALLGFAPNPLRAGSGGALVFSLAHAGPARVEVFDLSGRRVATVFDARGAEGENRVAWDARDQHGRPVPGGIYFYRLSAEGRTLARKVAVLAGAN